MKRSDEVSTTSRVAGGSPDFRFLISDCQLAFSSAPIENRQLTIGNRETHPLREAVLTSWDRASSCCQATNTCSTNVGIVVMRNVKMIYGDLYGAIRVSKIPFLLLRTHHANSFDQSNHRRNSENIHRAER